MKILFTLVFTVILFLQVCPVPAQFDPDSLEIKIGRIMPSGVYYYSLAIGDYKETKSMILIK
ncbi:MAG: hypothetical protein IPM96_04835 [Ignavibacteria bacterium]|nr:hypothetical protein [Ignavibacteria bacterium]